MRFHAAVNALPTFSPSKYATISASLAFAASKAAGAGPAAAGVGAGDSSSSAATSGTTAQAISWTNSTRS